MTLPAAPSDSLFDDGSSSAEPRAAAAVTPAWLDEGLFRLGRQLPASVYLGTSSWSFPGWQDIVYSRQYTEAQLARAGLAAYAQHPVLRAVDPTRVHVAVEVTPAQLGRLVLGQAGMIQTGIGPPEPGSIVVRPTPPLKE